MCCAKKKEGARGARPVGPKREGGPAKIKRGPPQKHNTQILIPKLKWWDEPIIFYSSSFPFSFFLIPTAPTLARFGVERQHTSSNKSRP